MIARFFLGLFLNLVVGFASLLLASFVTMFVVIFDVILGYPLGSKGGLILYYIIGELAIPLLFFGFNALYARGINRKMKSLCYEKKRITIINILYWFGAAVLFYLPVVLTFWDDLRMIFAK